MSTTPRRRVLRTTSPEAVAAHRRQQRRHKQPASLAQERAAFERWMVKLRRAFHTVERKQRAISRLERELARAE